MAVDLILKLLVGRRRYPHTRAMTFDPTSSRAILISGVTSENTVGCTKYPLPSAL